MNIILIKTLAAGMLLSAVSNANPADIFASASLNSPKAETAQNAPDAMSLWLNKLAYKESEGRSRIKVLDHNNQYSYGCLQFQMQTFRSYVRKYDLLPDTEDGELENIIYDCGFQKTLARKMIEDDYANWRNWYTSVSTRKLGLPPKPPVELADKN